ncbi:uncharacterized protein BDZ99DRAFT_552114 [Mytilinidion resinicola]|uniref:Uncharacterized protein n=1 Tax=Mytilinidion resinicola TaxID=574789 RepID=A0A6A6XZB1_9PEZI|nr:uncharacterized protein BDZ99DRAFT_552114 [Mytilinidion resinicola]KAF2801901.1 hypothetical protein BDZ99DRAFT_552114 [Mytilinidion resinicola]
MTPTPVEPHLIRLFRTAGAKPHHLVTLLSMVVVWTSQKTLTRFCAASEYARPSNTSGLTLYVSARPMTRREQNRWN